MLYFFYSELNASCSFFIFLTLTDKTTVSFLVLSNFASDTNFGCE